MSRPYYTDYVRHCARFYARWSAESSYKTRADRENWLACAKVINGYSDYDRALLLDVYRSYDAIGDAVYEVAKQRKIDQTVVWNMMESFELKVAKKRGLM